MTKKRRLPQSDVMWAAAAVMLVLLQFWWIPGDAGSIADSYSNTADGKLGLYNILSQLFSGVTRETELLIPRERCELMIIGPDRYPSTQEQQQLYSFVSGGGTLVFAPKYSELNAHFPVLGIQTTRQTGEANAESLEAVGALKGGQPASGATANAASAATDSQTQTATSGAGNSESGLENGTSGNSASAPVTAPATAGPPVNRFETDAVTANSTLSDDVVTVRSSAVVVTSGEDWQKIVTSVSGQTLVAARPLGHGQILVCASPDIFSNRSLMQKTGCRLAVRIVERGRMAPHAPEWITSNGLPGIVISEYFNASDSFQSTGVLLSPALRLGTLQLLLLAVLAIWLAFHRFGPAKYVIQSRRRTLTESAQSVGNLQYRLRDGGTIVGNYLEYLNSQLRRRYGSLVRVDDPISLARRSGMTEEEVRENLHRAQQLVSRPRVTSAEASRSIRWLCRLMQGLNGNRTVASAASPENTKSP